MHTSDALDALLPALVKARANFKPVVREATGQIGQNRAYKYADLAGVLDALAPALTQHGLTVVQTVDAESSTLLSRLLHTSGQWIESAYPLTFPSQTPQQIGAQLSYGRRYSLLALLCVAQEDDDAVAVPAHPPAKSATNQKPAQAPAEGQRTGEAHIVNLTRDSGEKNGKPWTRWRVTFDDYSPMATTFSQSLGDSAQQAYSVGAFVRYTTQLDAKGVRLVALDAPMDYDGTSPF